MTLIKEDITKIYQKAQIWYFHKTSKIDIANKNV